MRHYRLTIEASWIGAFEPSTEAVGVNLNIKNSTAMGYRLADEAHITEIVDITPADPAMERDLAHGLLREIRNTKFRNFKGEFDELAAGFGVTL